MKIEEQVCTLEQGKRLTELNIKKRSAFSWKEFEHKKTKEVIIGWTFGGVGEWQSLKSYNIKNNYPAFTVAELGVMLPDMFASRFGADVWNCYNDNFGDHAENSKVGFFKTEAEARAAMLIYLLENNLITADEVNARLNQ